LIKQNVKERGIPKLEFLTKLEYTNHTYDMAYGGTVYILTNKHNTTFYVGVTSDISSRLREHINKVYPKSFSARYNLNRLVYLEHLDHIEGAIKREKYIKGKSRKWKIDLIESQNPGWNDLGPEILKW